MGDWFLLSVDMHRPTILLLLAASVFGRKFCPGERNGNRCAAGDKAFKCGVFFYNLQGDGNLQFLAELPKALKKTKKEYWPEILGDNITPATFEDNINCDAATGTSSSAHLARLWETTSAAKSGVGSGETATSRPMGNVTLISGSVTHSVRTTGRLWLPAPPPSPPASRSAAQSRASSRDATVNPSIRAAECQILYSPKYRINQCDVI